MKINYCLIGLTLFFSGIYMSFLNKDTDEFRRFYGLLNTDQKEIYENIVKERLLIYLAGSLLGLGIGYYYYSTNKNDDYLFCKLLLTLALVQ